MKSRNIKWIVPCLLVFCAAVIFATVWPFRQEAIVKVLEEESFSKVAVGTFHRTYFPYPGCVLENVVFQHNPKSGTPPLITVQRIRIEGGFAGLFAKQVKLVRVEGMRIFIPPLESEKFETPQRSSVVVDDLVADGAVLEVASRTKGNPPLRFTFHGFTMSGIGGNGPASFKATLSNPEPPGAITTTGKFGPWNAEAVGKTPVSGEYYFRDADLSTFPGISGVLSSSGKYGGTLNHVEVEGNTEIPTFLVKTSSHKIKLQTQFHAVVNAENGDVFLQGVNTNFRQSSVWAKGSVAGEEGKNGKTASLEITAKDGRIQDFLLIFINSPRAPMAGIVSFKAKVLLPPDQDPFLEKVQLQGDFGIGGGSFTKPETQQGVNNLSGTGEENHEAKDKDDESDPQNVMSDLKGHVLLKDGTAHFSNLSFSVPGASAQMDGTYNLISEKIDLRGMLTTKKEVSDTTHGIKALLLKVLDPFLKHKPVGYVTPVKIAGTYDHPSFGLDLHDDKNRNARSHTAHLQEQVRH